MSKSPFIFFCLMLVLNAGQGQMFYHRSSGDIKDIAGGITLSASNPLHEVVARISDKKSGRPANGIRGYLSVPGTDFQFHSAISDNEGNLKFLLTDIDISKPMLFLVDEITDSAYRIESIDPFATAAKYPIQKTDTTAFYGRADKTYLLDDYTRFPSIEEILIEYVPEVKLMKTRNTVRFAVANTPFGTFFETDPLVLLDGVPVFDLKKLMALDPLKIRKLEVMARKYYFGSLACNGIVSFTTYDGDLAGYAPGESATVATYHK